LIVILVSPMHTPCLFACLHELVSCVYSFYSYIHRRPVLRATLVLQTGKLNNDICVWVYWNSIETWLLSKQLEIVIHMLNINNEMSYMRKQINQYDHLSKINYCTLWHINSPKLLLSLCVLFYSSFVYTCVCVFFHIQSPLREFRSIRSGPSGLLYYCAPVVCISDVIQLLAVWRHNQPKPNPADYIHIYIYIYIYI